jgi:hypothetical protein
MKFENLPQKLQELLSDLKHASSTIENDIRDALEDAENDEDFASKALSAMENLGFEVNHYHDIFYRWLIPSVREATQE